MHVIWLAFPARCSVTYGGLVKAERSAPETETDEVIVNILKMSQYLRWEKEHTFVEQNAIKKI